VTIRDATLEELGCVLPAPFALPAGVGASFVLCTTPLGCPTNTSACANPLLGEAAGCTVLQLGGGQVTIGGAAGGILGHVCIGPGGSVEVSGSQFVTEEVRLAPGAKLKTSGSATVGAVRSGVDLSAQIQAAQRAARDAANLPCNVSVGVVDRTTAFQGRGGLNVLCLGHVRLKGEVITLAGSAADVFILNVRGDFKLENGSQVRVVGGVLPRNVLVNVIGGGPVTFTGGSGGAGCCESVLDGTLLALDSKANLNPGRVNGAVISGQDIAINGGASVQCPGGALAQAWVSTARVTATVDASRIGGCAYDEDGGAVTVAGESSARVECLGSRPAQYPPACPCDLGYPLASDQPRTSVKFNGNALLRAISPDVAQPGDTIKLWYNDEDPLLLGARRVIVKSSGGTATADYPVTAMGRNPDSALAPQCGATALSGDLAGLDAQDRPLFPALFITDITADPSSRAGDWQFGGAPIPPHAVFGAWKAGVRTLDKTKATPKVTLSLDANPAKNHWNLAEGDPAPLGLVNLGYGAELRWNVDDLGLVLGRVYRLQFMVHDGKADAKKAEVGQVCATMAFGVATPPCGTEPALVIRRTEAGLVVTWTPANAVLQEADELTGPWRDVDASTVSAGARHMQTEVQGTVTLPTSARYYRLRRP
jgi:hypothetical protein